jgi:hypothetical protein
MSRYSSGREKRLYPSRLSLAVERHDACKLVQVDRGCRRIDFMQPTGGAAGRFALERRPLITRLEPSSIASICRSGAAAPQARLA